MTTTRKIKFSNARTQEQYSRLLIAEANAPFAQALSAWQLDATASDVRKGWMPHFGALPTWARR